MPTKAQLEAELTDIHAVLKDEQHHRKQLETVTQRPLVKLAVKVTGGL